MNAAVVRGPMHINAPISLFLLTEIEGRTLCTSAKPVDRSQYRLAGHQPFFKLEFTRKIDEHDTDENGEQTLTGKNQHENTRKNENIPGKIPDTN